MPREEFTVKLAHKFPEYSLGPVAPNGHAKSLSNNDADLCYRGIPSTGQQVKEVRRDAASMPFDPFDVPTRPEEHA
jgi:hypothetical protein